jgi:hypothetical protein
MKIGAVRAGASAGVGREAATNRQLIVGPPSGTEKLQGLRLLLSDPTTPDPEMVEI